MSEKILKQARTEDIQIIENILLDMVSWLNEQLPSFHRTITHGAKRFPLSLITKARKL